YKQSLSIPLKPVGTGSLFDPPGGETPRTGTTVTSTTKDEEIENPRIPPVGDKIATLRWSGDVPAQKWMNFYTKVLSRFATTKSLRLTVAIEVAPDGGVSNQS